MLDPLRGQFNVMSGTCFHSRTDSVPPLATASVYAP